MRFHSVWFKNFCLVARSGCHGKNQAARVQVLVANIGIFTHILWKVFKFLVAKSGYQQPKSGSPSKFQIAWGYRATTKPYTDFIFYWKFVVKTLQYTLWTLKETCVPTCRLNVKMWTLSPFAPKIWNIRESTECFQLKVFAQFDIVETKEQMIISW